MTHEHNDRGEALPSVIVAMTIFAVCVAAALAGYHRGTVAVYNARAEQEATAVMAWYAALAQEDPNPSDPCASDPPLEIVGNLAGYDFTAEQFRAGWCAGQPIDWPPDACVDTNVVPSTVPPECKPNSLSTVDRLVVTVEWDTHTGQTRSREHSTVLLP